MGGRSNENDDKFTIGDGQEHDLRVPHAIGMLFQGQAAMAQSLPVAGAEFWLDAAVISTDGSGNVTLWENQVAGAPGTTDFAPHSSSPITVTPNHFQLGGTPGVKFGDPRGTSGSLKSRMDRGDWFDYSAGYTIFVVEQGLSGDHTGGSVLFAVEQEFTFANKIGINLDGSGSGFSNFARNTGATLFTGGGTATGSSLVILVSRLDTTPSSETLELYQYNQDGSEGFVSSGTPDAGGYGGATVPDLSVRLGANISTATT